ncbi:MAG: rRNA maturation RNase YbeY [Bacteroidetes bacterium]|nr:rRNA maturation RNase YbeY [Bacteroidota bacterium]MBU1678401.1 rRNA maturation RNase YbeY [Bacteroidota bacterium]MBU2508495.1 rRNA maturation RNase YbeY [Bacteroidota bacterium]
MLNNLWVNSTKQIKIEKKSIHRIVLKLKEILNFNVNSLQINFVDDDYIHEINKTYLNHDYSTDIITFNYSSVKNALEGEIYICIKDAIDNSQKFNVNLDSEIVRLVTHGILHLLGYDDITIPKKKKMKTLEDELVFSIEKNFKNLLIKYDC